MNNRLSRSDPGIGCFVVFRLFICERAASEGGWNLGLVRVESADLGGIAMDVAQRGLVNLLLIQGIFLLQPFAKMMTELIFA